MSARALLRAVEARLRAFLDDPDGKVCGIQPFGKPPPNFGQRFTAVSWLGATDRREATTADQVDLDHAITLTVTDRKGNVPGDRRGQVLVAEGDLIDFAEALTVPGVIHGNYVDVMNAANALIPGTAEYVAIHGGSATTNGFEEPLLFLGYGPVQEKPGSWVGSREGPEVLVIEVRFGMARRLQV